MVPLVVPEVVPVVLPEVVPLVLPDVLPEVEPDVLSMVPEVLPDVEPLVEPAFSEVEQALSKVRYEHKAARVSAESMLRFTMKWKCGKEEMKVCGRCYTQASSEG